MSSKLTFRPYNEANDGIWYAKCWNDRGFGRIPAMPKVSTVVMNSDGLPVAAGGLVLTDSDYTLPDGFCTNPSASKEDRQKGLNLLFRWAAETTLKLGFSSAILMTSSTSIADHAIMVTESSKDLGLKLERFDDFKIFRFEGKLNNG